MQGDSENKLGNNTNVFFKLLLKYLVINFQSFYNILLQVFLTEYAGPLILYLVFYLRPAIVYGSEAASLPKEPVVQ